MVAILFVINSSCLKSKKPGFPPEIIEILNNSDIHKPGYLRILLTYRLPEDSLKLKSAYFILKNLESNYSVIQSLADTSDNEIIIDINDFSNFGDIQNYLDSIELSAGKLHYKTDSIWLDFKNIDPDFLINHIDTSFFVWETTQSNQYDFNDFCQYILPYRVANEEVEYYITHFQNKYGHIAENNPSIPEIAKHLNSEINKKLKYDNRLEFDPNCRSIQELEESGIGNLQEINIYKVKALRSLGIAAALDFTPYFADSTLGYYSTTVILPGKEKMYLVNTDKQENLYGDGNVAKVYRRTFHNVPECLFSIKDIEIHTPSYLGDFNYLDVTSEYMPTIDTSLLFNDTCNFVYVAVKNDDKLVAIDWSSPDSTGLSTFKNLGKGIVYTPVVLIDKEMVKVGEHFEFKN